jgi:hypothetical protein
MKKSKSTKSWVSVLEQAPKKIQEVRHRHMCQKHYDSPCHNTVLRYHRSTTLNNSFQSLSQRRLLRFRTGHLKRRLVCRMEVAVEQKNWRVLRPSSTMSMAKALASVLV